MIISTVLALFVSINIVVGQASPTSEVYLSPTISPSCGNDLEWYLYSNKCYHVRSKDGTEVKSWQGANNFCMKHGGYLVSINTGEEQKLVHKLLSTKESFAAWIGLRELDFGDGPEYRWIDDESVVEYKNWSPGEPDDRFGEEKCVDMKEHNGLWYVTNCGDKLSFVCKKDIGMSGPITKAPTSPPPGHCPLGHLEHNGKCYSFNGKDIMVTWAAARGNCRSRGPGADLVAIHSRELQAFLTSYMREMNYSLWIGLNDRKSEGVWRWTDGSEVNYLNWAPNEPNGETEENCCEISPGFGGLWNDWKCSESAAFICQEEKDPHGSPSTGTTCDNPDYLPHWNGCYRIIPGFYTHEEAEQLCVADDAMLVSIEDNFENAFIEYQMLAHGNPVWLGLSDKKQTGVFKWSDGSPVMYTRWGQDEPSQGSNEGCVQMKTDGFWDDTYCLSTASAFCKYWTGPKPTTLPPGSGFCPVDTSWEAYGGYCYHFSKSKELKSWPEAVYECQRLEGHIVTISSPQENSYLQRVLQENHMNVWIGLNRNKQGVFEWVDEQPVSYTNWAEDEPNGHITGEDCVEMFYHSGEWNDVDCYQKLGFVCKTQKVQGIAVSSGSSGGAVAGAVIGTLLAVIVILFVVYLFYSGRVSPPECRFPDLSSLCNFWKQSPLVDEGAFENPSYVAQEPPNRTVAANSANQNITDNRNISNC
ncbi:macrophage mannose receptor 1-like [Ptychodera flava]|uniref:macrophage mannose receptor 1-like n=1 Tax=Ptychodera flava TaxID=63121 RepID=UPI00396A725F